MKLKINKGFTLIEILISLFLFSVLSIFMMNAVDQTTKSQEQIEKIIKKNRIVQNASYVIRKDLQMAYSTLNVKNWMRNRYKGYLEKYGSQHPINQNDEIYFEKYDFDETGLIGEENSFFFTSSSQNLDSHRPPIVKIGYALESCPAKESEQCLLRKTSLLKGLTINSLDQESLNQTVLFKNVKSLKISYWNFRDKEWKTSFTPYILKGIYFPHPFPIALKFDLEFNNIDRPISMIIPIHLSFLSQNILNINDFNPSDILKDNKS